MSRARAGQEGCHQEECRMQMRSGSKRTRRPAETAAPEAQAREAGLVYSNDGDGGITRVRSGKGFRYVAPDGRAIREARELRRIRGLAVPPAWTNVWICP